MQGEQKWFYLACASMGVMGLYVCLDLLNKRKIKRYELNDNSNNNIKSKNSSNDNMEEVITQMQEPSVNTLNKNRNNDNGGYKIHKLCITGGPCAGKTTGLAYVAEKLREHDIAVFIVPEVATMIAAGGGMIKSIDFTNDDAVNFQTSLLLAQCHLEDLFMDIALLARQESVILTDRGLMDGSAYMKPENWQTLLDEKGWNEVTLRDRRYDAVIHLVTAADGATEYYNLDNAARYERNLQDAIDVDRKIQNAWIGHPNFQLVDNKNTKNFEHKKNRLLSIVSKLIGRPNTKKLRYKRKFIIATEKGQFKIPEDIKTKIFTIEDVYLRNEESDGLMRIRKSFSQGYYTYTYSSKTPGPNHEYIKTKRQISPREYFSLMQQKDCDTNTINRERICFIANNYFIIDLMKFNKQITLIKVEVENFEGNIDFPDFIKVVKEVTNETNYKSHTIANKKNIISEADLDYFSIEN